LATPFASSSTERLLKTIRGDSSSQKTPEPAPQRPQRKKQPRHFAKKPLFSIKKAVPRTVIGLDIGPSKLRLAVIQHHNETPLLQHLMEKDYPVGGHPGELLFAEFLKSTLTEVHAGHNAVEIWTLVSTAQADIWRLSIPKVPEKHIPETLYWAAHKAKHFVSDDVIFDYQLHGERLDRGVQKIDAVAYTVPRKFLTEVQELVASAGFTLTGATITPFALQNLCQGPMASTQKKSCASVFIGRYWSRIDIFENGKLVLSRGVKAGLESMVEELQLALRSPSDQQGTDANDAGLLDYSFSMQMEGLDPTEMPGTEAHEPSVKFSEKESREYLIARLLGTPLPDSVQHPELELSELMNIISPALTRLVRQIDRTFDHHINAEHGQAVEQVYFSGLIAASKPVRDFLSAQLSQDCSLFDPLGSDRIAHTQIKTPKDIATRTGFNLTIALALSSQKDTPNLLHTYQDRIREKSSAQITQYVFAAFLSIFILQAGFWGWQQYRQHTLTQELEQNMEALNAQSPRISKTFMDKLVKRVEHRQKADKRRAKRYESLAALREITQITPTSIKLLRFDLELSPGPATQVRPARRRQSQANTERLLVLEGHIQDQRMPDSILASYLVKLENSQLFSRPVIMDRQVQHPGAQSSGLYFTLHVRVES